jgi:hypothetical protein
MAFIEADGAKEGQSRAVGELIVMATAIGPQGGRPTGCGRRGRPPNAMGRLEKIGRRERLSSSQFGHG